MGSAQSLSQSVCLTACLTACVSVCLPACCPTLSIRVFSNSALQLGRGAHLCTLCMLASCLTQLKCAHKQRQRGRTCHFSYVKQVEHQRRHTLGKPGVSKNSQTTLSNPAAQIRQEQQLLHSCIVICELADAATQCGLGTWSVDGR